MNEVSIGKSRTQQTLVFTIEIIRKRIKKFEVYMTWKFFSWLFQEIYSYTNLDDFIQSNSQEHGKILCVKFMSKKTKNGRCLMERRRDFFQI